MEHGAYGRIGQFVTDHPNFVQGHAEQVPINGVEVYFKMQDDV